MRIRRLNHLTRILISVAFGCMPNAAFADECQHLGLIDLKGEVIVPFEYDSIGTAPDGNFELIRYGNTAHRVLVDHDGKPIKEGSEKQEAEPTFPPGTSVLAQSPAGYSIRNEKRAGFADKKGNVILPCEYISAVSVGDGFLAASKMDLSGPRVVRYRLIKDGAPTEVAELVRGTYYILFDPSGKEIAEFPLWAMLFSSRFSEGLLRVGYEMENPTGFIDHSGAIVLTDPNIICRENFHDGLAVVYDRSKKVTGWIDHSGKLVAKTAPDSIASSFSQKRSIVTVRDGKNSSKCGLVDITGKFVLPPQYQDLYLYAPNLYLALKNDRLSFLDNNGKVICLFPAECTAVGRQDDVNENSLIPCAFFGDRQPDAKGYLPPPGARWGYCDMSGRVVIKPAYGATEPQYGEAEPFQGDLAVVHLNTTVPGGLMGLIDRSGKLILPVKYRYLAIRSPDRISAILANNIFSATAWQKSVASRNELLKVLLSQQPLIGLQHSELVKLLGAGDMSPISNELLPTGVSSVTFYKADDEMSVKNKRDMTQSASEQSRGFEFGLDSQDKVFGWRIISAEKRGAWIFENVDLYDSKFETAIGNVMPR